jgi:hypothetical protein
MREMRNALKRKRFTIEVYLTATRTDCSILDVRNFAPNLVAAAVSSLLPLRAYSVSVCTIASWETATRLRKCHQ